MICMFFVVPLRFLDMSYTAHAQLPHLSFTVSHPALPCGSPGHMGVDVLAIEIELYCWVVLVHTFNPRIWEAEDNLSPTE